MEKSIFQLASEYNFDAVFDYHNNGNSINICDEDGNSLFATFLSGYACYGDIVEDEEELLKTHDECDYEFWDSFLSEKKKTPLDGRNGGEIVKQLEWFLSNGVDINLCDLSKLGMVDTPLSVAVCDEDYYLTKFLLEHGANPKVWLFSERHPWENYEDWLIEHMDVKMMDSKGEQFENELHIAAILAHYGLDDFKVLSLAYEMLEKHIADSEDEPDIATIIEAQNKELEKWEKKLDNYIEMRADGEISKEVFLAKTGDINDRIAEIKKYLMSLQQDNSEVEERDYDSLLEALKKELEAYVDFESSTEIPDQILEAFIEKIVVHKDSFEWHLRIPTANTRCEIGEEEGMTDEVESVIEFLEKEETPTSQKLLISEFTMTKDDALKYQRSQES